MEWFNRWGNMLQFTDGDAPLAFDFATGGPAHDMFNYSLAYNMQATPTPLPVYPTDPTPLVPTQEA